MPKDERPSKKRKSEEPKRRADSDDDTSDTSIEEEERKPKSSSKNSSGDEFKTADDGSAYLDIDHNRRVSVRDFRGRTYVDIREFYEKDGKMLPGKKGISLSVSQYRKLQSVMPAIDKKLQ